MMTRDVHPRPTGWRARVHETIFEADTPGGKFFDVVLILAIIASVVVVMCDSVRPIREAHGFTSIPRSVYWAIVTLTTVGYGDISPQTGLGQALAAVLMILGYSIIVVPTGFVTLEHSREDKPISTQACPQCSAEGHDSDALHCKYCGEKL